MKKGLFFTCLLAVICGNMVFGQCTPDPNNTVSFFSPSPTAPLPSGVTTVPYAQVITVNVPTDTSINLGALIGFPYPPVTVTVNQLALGIPNGLPIGIFGNTNPGNGIILGGDHGCIDLAGTPTTSGQYVINIPGQLNVLVPAQVPVIGGTTQNIPVQVPYNMEVTQFVAVTPGSASGFQVSQSLPNPTSGMTVIRYSVSSPSDMRLDVMSIAGERVYSATQKAMSGDQAFRFDASDIAPGLYLYRLSDGHESIVRKMVIE